jgi:hypothetical protein
MVLVASSSNRIAMKITIENQTVTKQGATPNEIRSVSVPHITDFFEARHQLMLEYREIDNIQETTAPRVNDDRRHKASLASAKSVEAALYWFVSAPTLLYLIYLVVRPLIDLKP